MPPLNSLRAFEAAARHASIVKAAEELHVSHSAVSQQIKLLEEYLGLTLLDRRSGKISVLDSARPYAAELHSAFALIRQATQQLLNSNDEHVLTINLLSTFAMRWLIPRLQNFQDQYPQIDIRLSTPTRRVNFETESIDLAIYYGDGHWPGLHTDFLFHEYFCCVCSPKLFSKIKRWDLATVKKQCKFIYISAEMRKSVWQLWFKQAGLSEPERANRIFMESSMQAIEAAVNGLGIALIPELFIREDVAAKRLAIFPKQKIKSPSSFYLVFPELSLQKKKVQVFRDWLLTQAAG